MLKKLLLKYICIHFLDIEELLPFHGQCWVCSANNFKANYHLENYLVYYTISEIKMSCAGLCQIWSQGEEWLNAIYPNSPSICLLWTLGAFQFHVSLDQGLLTPLKYPGFHKWMTKWEDQTHFILWSKPGFEFRSQGRQGHKVNILFHSIVQLLFVLA